MDQLLAHIQDIHNIFKMLDRQGPGFSLRDAYVQLAAKGLAHTNPSIRCGGRAARVVYFQGSVLQ